MSGMFRALVATAASLRTWKKGQAVVPICDVNGRLIVNTDPNGVVTTAAADATANPSAPGVVSYLEGFNGATWDRVRTGIVAKVSTFVGLLNTLSMGRYNLAPPALTDGDAQLLQLDASGNLRQVVQNPAVAVDDVNGKIVVEHRYSGLNVTAINATVVKAGAGLLHSIMVNKWVTGLVITIYDNTAASGTKLATFTYSATDTGPIPFPPLDVSFATGLTINLSAAADVTVSYR